MNYKASKGIFFELRKKKYGCIRSNSQGIKDGQTKLHPVLVSADGCVVTSVFETVALNIQLFLKRCKITQNKILT